MEIKNNNKKIFKSGFSFVEIITVLAIIGSLVFITFFSFSDIGKKQALEKTTISIIAILNEAKSMAISSKDSSDYGVRIESDKITSFKNTYNTNINENKIYVIPNLVNISDISVAGGNDIIFKKISGSTISTGTIKISVVNNLLEYSLIKISKTGLVEKI